MGVTPDARRSVERLLDAQIAGARVVGIGEAAHFVREFNVLRAQAVATLVDRHGFTHLALEVGHDEAPAVIAWLRSTARSEMALQASVGPLTFLLYGTFLVELGRLLGDRCEGLGVLGVDLPNSLMPEASLGPLARILVDVDSDGTATAEDLRRRCGAVAGGSAAATAFTWMSLPESERDAITAQVVGLGARVGALQPMYEDRASGAVAESALHVAEAATTTVLMLRAMADLFSGGGREAETSIRERYVADRLLATLAALPDSARIAYVAHNNHVQRTPVIFDGALVALSAGSYLLRELGGGYAAIGLTHLDDEVPEMEITGAGALGFEIVRVAVAPPSAGSVEAIAAELDVPSSELLVVTPRDVPTGTTLPQTIRSQSAVAHAPLGEAFDCVLIVRTASSDARSNAGAPRRSPAM